MKVDQLIVVRMAIAAASSSDDCCQFEQLCRYEQELGGMIAEGNDDYLVEVALSRVTNRLDDLARIGSDRMMAEVYENRGMFYHTTKGRWAYA